MPSNMTFNTMMGRRIDEEHPKQEQAWIGEHVGPKSDSGTCRDVTSAMRYGL